MDGLGAGVFLIFFAARLDIWRHRPERLANLWLAAVAFSALIVNFTAIFLKAAEAGGHPIVVMFNLIGVAGVVVSLLELVFSLAETSPPRLIRGLEFILLPLTVLRISQNTVMIIVALLLLVTLFKAIKSASQGNADARGVLWGLAVLLICLVSDIVHELGLANVPNFLPVLGFIVFFLMATHAINSHLAKEESSARTDPLTGMLNRRGFLELSRLVVSIAERSARSFSIIMIDLDHFKRVNDKFGHAMGDRVLQEIASILLRGVRDQDILARWGGEEVIVLLPDTGVNGANALGEKIRTSVEELETWHDETRICVTLSLGISQYHRGEPLTDTIQRADNALYRAKSSGRNRVEYLAFRDITIGTGDPIE
ncbi:MAG: GGDEF domain-containing protein [Candidatus Aegiribacteria sp.]|nr:GGDEF domain-containing protein [Candidatus Aegiribacteria sp.]